MDAATGSRLALGYEPDHEDERTEKSGISHPQNIYSLEKYTRYKVQVYEDLGFSEFIAGNRDKGDLSVNWNNMTVLGPEELIKDLIEDFDAGIISKDVEIKVTGVGKLFFKDDGSIQDNISAYIQKRFQMEFKHCYFDMIYDRNPDEVKGYVYCRSHDDASRAKSLIEKGFCSFQLGDHSKEVKRLIGEWKDKHKLLETTDSDGHTIITCTSDVRQKFEVEQTKQIIRTLPLSSRYAKFLIRQENLLDKIRQQRHVDISFIKGQNSLSLGGTNADIKLALGDIKSSMVHECITIQENPSGYLASEFDKIADRNNCCWLVKRTNDTDMIWRLDGCRYIASWHDQARLSSLTVIEGDSCNLPVDCLIVLCTDKLFPLQFAPDEEVINISKTYAGKPPNDIGKIVIIDIKSANYRNVALLVVGSSHPTSKERNKTFYGLSSCLKNIFMKAEEKQWKTICLSVHGEEDFISTSMISDAYIEAVVDCQKQKMALYFYLFCDTRKDVDRMELLKSIEKRYKKEVGFFRKLHEHGALEMRGLEKMKEPCIEVAQGSIENMKVDIIVNTTSTTLDLSKGKVSQQLLSLAGDEMEKACKKQYPDGIDYTTIAVTSPFRLKETNRCVNYVFHAALRPFKRESYLQNIKIFIWCCLAEADRLKCKSIAFPALGTGNLGYPRREVAKAMFDAVEEYRIEAVNPFVERVVFSLYAGDEDACVVFKREGKRRSSVEDTKMMTYNRQSNTELKPNVRKLIGTISRKPHPIEVIVAVITDLEPLNSNVVRIKWFESTKFGLDWKYCEDKPETDNDMLLVSCGESKQSSINLKGKQEDKVFKTAVTNVLTYCIKNRIAEICFDISRWLPSVPDETKVEIISSELAALKEGDMNVLHTVFVQLGDTKTFDGMKDSLIQRESIGNKILSVFPRSSKVNWKLNDSSLDDKQVQIEIVGGSSEILQKVKEEMLLTAHRIASRSEIGSSVDIGFNGARPKTFQHRLELKDDVEGPNDVVQPELSGRYGEDADSSYASDESDIDEEVDEVFKVVSAQINAGFIEFKEKYNDFDRWRGLVEKTYGVRLSRDRHPPYRVQGTYKQISDLKTYLDNKFPADPQPIKRKKKSKDRSKQVPGLNNIPVDESLAQGNKQDLPIIEDHFRQSEPIFLPGGELESFLFMNIVSQINKGESVAQMQYYEQQRGLVLTYNGHDKGLTAIKEAHRRYRQNVRKIEMELMDMNETAQGNEAAKEGMLHDKVICRFIPPDDKIVIVGKDDASARDSEQRISKFLGRPNISTKQLHSTAENHAVSTSSSSFSSSSSKGNQRDGGSHTETPQAVCVKIYRCGVDEASVDGLVVPYSSDISPLAERVFDAGGKEIEKELQRSIEKVRPLESGKCRVTGPGDLKNYKKLIHMCLDETNDVNISLLKEAVLNSLKEAHYLCLDKVAVLLTGLSYNFYSGNAEHYFDAIKLFTQQKFKYNKVKEIHLIHVDDQRTIQATKTFERMAKIEGIEYHGSHFIFLATPSMQQGLNVALHRSGSLLNQDPTFVLGKSNVKVTIAMGSVTSVDADGIVCFQDEYFSLTNPTARDIYEMCGQKYKSEIDKEVRVTHRQGTILAVPSSGGGITCKYVINVVLPRWKPEQLEEGFISTLKGVMSGILMKTEELQMKSLAIPSLESFHDLQSNQQHITERVSEAMASTIFQFYTEHENVYLRRLDILVTEPGMLESLKTSFEGIGCGDKHWY